MNRAWFAENRSVVLRWTGVGLLMLASGSLLARAMFDGEEPATSDRPTHVEIKGVLNGHAVKIERDDEEARLVYAGIRAPFAAEALHAESKQRNRALVEGREVRLRFPQQPRDFKDRLQAYVFVGSDLVNEILVREGMAYVRLTTTTRRFADRLLAAQRAAREDRVGIWQHVGASDEADYPADPKYGGFHRPSCDVARRIKPERLVRLPNKDAAFDQGLAPCHKCAP